MLLLKLNCRLHGEAVIGGCSAGAPVAGTGSGVPNVYFEGRAPTLSLFMIFPMFSDFYFTGFVPLLACLESFEASLGHWSEFCPFTEIFGHVM